MGKILWDSGYWDDELARMESAAKDATERQLKDGEGRSAWTSTYLSDNPGSNFFSIIAVVATDAPLVPHQVSDPYWSGTQMNGVLQLKRIAKRVALGLGRQGAMGENFSCVLLVAHLY